ncbi:MAG TPA: AraC family transcriptional regulator [Pyrinomonadaceae bacterium]|jgi:AraC family transcriptional regulator
MNLGQDSLHGTVIRSGTIADFTLTETAYAPDLRLPRHAHQSPYFCFVLRGNFTETYGRKTRACKQSSLIFHPPGETHADQFHTGARCFNVQMTPRWAERVRPQAAVNLSAEVRDVFLARLSSRLYREFRQADELSPLVVEGLALEILGASARRLKRGLDRRPPPWLERARELIRDELTESVTLARVAESVGVHKTHLCREFRRHYRCTVGEYVRQLRVEFARRRLSHSDSPVGEIAVAAGFFDQSHFTKTFRLHVGMTPGEYRELYRPR